MVKKADPPLNVQIPRAVDDQPSWLRVGVVAVVGFAIGVAWPKLAGVRLGPNAPATAAQREEAVAAPGASGATGAAGAQGATPRGAGAIKPEPTPSASLVAPSTQPSGVTPATEPTGSAGVAAGAGPTKVDVKPGIVLSCKTEAGEKLSGKACGTMTFDQLALPRLRRLASCPAAAGAEGKLSPQFHLDFVNSKLTVQMGKKNTVDNVDSFSACLGGLFEKVSINAVTHEHPRYSVLYNITFSKGEAKAGGAVSAATASGAATGAHANAVESTGNGNGNASEAKIAWDMAVVRDAPRTGAIVGRLPRGTQVQVMTTENNWYKVKGGTTEGWVYRGAIGR